MGEELAHSFQSKEGKQGPMRQGPVFCEAKHTYRQLNKEHVESTGEGNSSIHPANQARQSYRQRFKSFEEHNYMVHRRTGWKYYPSTSSSSSAHWEQHDDWKSHPEVPALIHENPGGGRIH